jgi:hypothetical protein
MNASIQNEYRRVIVVEVLRLCGVSRTVAEVRAIGPDFAPLWHTISALIDHFQKERIDLVEFKPELAIKWDLHTVWEEVPPVHLRPLRELLILLVPLEKRKYAAQCCRHISATRIGLIREETKEAIYSAMDHSHKGLEPDRTHIEQFITELVADGRRDFRFEVDGAVPIGFAVSVFATFIIFRENYSKRVFAVKEPSFFDDNFEDAGDHENRLLVRGFARNLLEFEDASAPLFDGAVRIF